MPGTSQECASLLYFHPIPPFHPHTLKSLLQVFPKYTTNLNHTPPYPGLIHMKPTYFSKALFELFRKLIKARVCYEYFSSDNISPQFFEQVPSNKRILIFFSLVRIQMLFPRLHSRKPFSFLLTK